jgi:hypothetical protein
MTWTSAKGSAGTWAKLYYRDSLELSRLVLERNLKHIAARVSGDAELVVFNPLGWSVDGCATATVPADRVKPALRDDAGRTLPVQTLSSDGENAVVCFPVQDVPPVGYRACRFVDDGVRHAPQATVAQDDDTVQLRNPQLQVRIDRRTGVITSLRSVASGAEFVRDEVPLNVLHLPFGDRVYRSQEGVQSVQVEQAGPVLASVVVEGALGEVARFRSQVRLHALSPHVEVETHLRFLQRPEPSMMRSLQTDIAARLERTEIWHDHPFAVTPIRAEGCTAKNTPPATG